MRAGVGSAILPGMWNEPYLETCCRSALHRLCLAGESGRPAGLADDPCLARMERMGLVCQSAEGRFVVTEAGVGYRLLDTTSFS